MVAYTLLMKLTLTKRNFTQRELKRFPELEHFSLPEDRWLIVRLHLQAIWPIIIAFAALLLVSLVYFTAFSHILGSEVVRAVLFGILSVFFADPMGVLMDITLAVALAVYLFPFIQGVPLIFLTGIIQPVRTMNAYHRALRERGIYYCANPKCRYNCTGIRGNICPECGAQVPGLSPV